MTEPAPLQRPLLQAIGAINSSLELDTVLQRITASARDLLRADIARIALREPGEETLASRHSVGAKADALAALRLERGKGIAGIVLASGQPFRTDDYLGDPRITRDFDEVARQEGIVTAIVVPILMDGRVEGILHLNNRRPTPFTADDEEVLVQIAGIAAIAIRNAFFATRLRTLARLTQLVSSALDPRQLLHAIADAAGDLMDAPFVAIWTADEERRTVERVALRSTADDPAPAPRPFRYGEGLVGLAALERRTMYIADVTNDPRVVRREWLVQQRVRSVLAVPILFEDSLLGVIAFSRRVQFAPSPEDSQTLDSFVAQAAIAIRNAQLFAQSEERRHTAEALVDLSHALTGVLDPDEVARRAVASVRRLLEVPSAALYRRTSDSADVRLLTSAQDPAAPTLDWAPVLPGGRGLGALSVEQARPVWSADVAADPRFDLPPDVRARLEAGGYGAVLAVPLIAVGGAFGSLVIADKVGRVYQPRDVRLARAFADQAAVALENARLHAETDRRRRAAEEFATISRVLTESLDVPTVAQRIVESVLPLFGAQWSALRVPQSDGSLVPLAVAGRTLPGFEPGFVIARGEGLVGRAIAEGKAVWTADVTTDAALSPAWRDPLVAAGPRAILAAPLRADGTTIGVLSVSHHAVHRYSDADVHLLETFADQAAIALRNARVVEDLARTQQQLAHAQKMEAVGQLAGGVAHDFNNLLTVMIGRTDFILDALAPAHPVRRDVEIVQSAAARAASLTQQLLAFGRKQVLRPVVLDLRDVVERLLPLLSRLLPESIAVLSHHQKDAAAVRADRGQIEQVLINLAVNARDAMPSGGRLVISTEAVTLTSPRPTTGGELATGVYVVLGVEDTGLGMEPEVQARIFEPFYTTKELGKGTGLGLSTVYGIVSQHGGGITVDSAVSRGATFRVYLPADAGAVDAPTPARAPAVTRGTESILVVEDQEELRRFVRETLERHGYTVLAAGTPTEALALASRDDVDIDLLLIDVVMPEMSGPETARLLRARRRGLPILYMTGYPGEALGTGVADSELIQKPFSSEDLLRRIRALLDAGEDSAPTS